MTDAHLWAAIALLALAGWAATNVFVGKANLPTANALGSLVKTNNAIDDRVYATIQRIQQRQQKIAPKPEQPESRRPTAEQAEMSRMFGGVSFGDDGPIPDQPPPGLEVAD